MVNFDCDIYQHLQNGPRKQGISICLLEFGSKERQKRDCCLGVERKWVRQNSR